MFRYCKGWFVGAFCLAMGLAEEVVDYDLWEVTPFFVNNTSSSLGETLRNDNIDYVGTYALGVNVGRVLLHDVGGKPLDGVLTMGLLWHDEQGFQDNFLHHTVLFKGVWKEFPWSNHMRTLVEIGTGASFTWRISRAEQENRSTDGQFRGSRNLLNYNEFSLGFHTGDLVKLTTGKELESLEKVWFMMGIIHRSGAWGAWGKSRNPATGETEGVLGALNSYYFGIKTTF